MWYLSFNPEKICESRPFSDAQISSDTLQEPNTLKKLSMASNI